jgi:hypothetical protein
VYAQCSARSKQQAFEFGKHFQRPVTARFDGGKISSDGGAVLLGEVDRRLGLLDRLADCFQDHRDPERIEHSVAELIKQRVYAIALGYEDLNDHDQLRSDPLLALLAGKRDLLGQQRRRERDRGQSLAGKSTLNRLERTTNPADRYKKISCKFERIDELLQNVFVEAHRTPPDEVILDLDVTDSPLHGRQEGCFFHGYYRHYCYLPLYIFAGEHLLCARQRTANQDAAAGSLEEVQRLVAGLRARWPKVRILVRADSGFCREELMAWCEDNEVDYVLGLARNPRLRERIEEEMRAAAERQAATGQAAREFGEFHYQTLESWSRERRVIAKAEQLEGKENPRYVVTTLSAEDWPPEKLYEELYCARGEMENRIKEQLSLFADRMSTQTLRANQLRLYVSALAYTLMLGLRRLGLQGTPWARAQTETLRRRLLKIGVRVRVTARRVWLSFAEGWPGRELFEAVWAALRSPPQVAA